MIVLKAKDSQTDLDVEYGAAMGRWLQASTAGEKSAVVKEFLELLSEGNRPTVLYLFNNIATPTGGQVPSELTFTKVKLSFMRGEKTS
jgi:hypothetical protein